MIILHIINIINNTDQIFVCNNTFCRHHGNTIAEKEKKRKEKKDGLSPE